MSGLRDIDAKCGPITVEEALQILSRFNESHFRGGQRECARYSIPADPRRDDDLRLGAFIRQSGEKDAELAALRAQNVAMRERLESIAECDCSALMLTMAFYTLRSCLECTPEDRCSPCRTRVLLAELYGELVECETAPILAKDQRCSHCGQLGCNWGCLT